MAADPHAGSQASGDLGGSLSVVATIGEGIFNISDAALVPASVSPNGVIAFTAADPSGTWTFSGTASGASIVSGRHTLSDGSNSIAWQWEGDGTGSIQASAQRATLRPSTFGVLAERLSTFSR